MTNVFNQDSLVWLPEPDEYMVPARVVSKFERGKAGQVKLIKKGKEASKATRVSAEESQGVIRMDEQSLNPIDDMVQLKNLDEPSILYNLKLRYNQDVIYTRVSKILVSINPFKMLPIYSPGVMDEYLSNGSRGLDPHIYGVGDDAFRAMLANKKDQSCIVSGESGAGKTEATKLFLQYIAEKSRREQGVRGFTGDSKNKKKKKGEAREDETLQNKVLEANPLMEAFGNAKTVRNDNSSRFGKWIEIQFKGGVILGGSIENYLLEKSRLVRQGEGERNYHIFYQLCAAASTDPELKKKFHLSDASQYHYLNQSKRSAIEIRGVDDADEYKTTRIAMEVVSLKEGDIMEIFSILSGILHLGNISFDSGKSGETSKVSNKDMLSLASEQLGIPEKDLEKALTKREIVAGRETTWGDNTKEMASDSRDAFAKQMYAVLFDWLIEQINASLGQAKKGDDIKTIGVLDIFGFETFDTNSFEQLCINYCNEKLQGHFNDHIFKLEQAEYAKEGVDVSKIDFADNEPTIAMIDAPKTKGILSLIQEEVKTGRDKDDMKLRGKILELAKSSDGVLKEPAPKDVQKNKHLKQCFIFVHYAGEVEYNVSGFIDKNTDLLQLALYNVGVKSNLKMLKSLFKNRVNQDAKKKTIGMQFRDQLNELMTKLKKTEPHFVRCIKPNSHKESNRFTSDMVLSQLRYAGVLEVCRIRKLGYPVRKEFDEFVNRYRPLVAGAKVKKGDAKALCSLLEKEGLLDPSQYQVGKNKVFIRDDQHEDLEATLEEVIARFVIKAQAAARRWMAKLKYKRWGSVREDIRKAIKKKGIDELEQALLNVGTLPYGGRHLAEVQQAQELLEHLIEDRRISELLEAAIESKDLAEIQSALKAAEEKGMGDKSLIKEAKDTIEKIKSERKIREELRAAVEKGTDIKALEAALKKASKAGLENAVEARDAETLLSRLQREKDLRKELEQAVKAKSLETCKKCMNELIDIGVSREDPLVKEAEQFVKEEAQASKEREGEQERLLDELSRAMESKNLNALNDLEVVVLKIGLEDNEMVKDAMVLRKELEKVQESSSMLATETRALTHKASTGDGISAKDIDSLSQALSEAKKDGVTAENNPTFKEAKKLLTKLEKQLEVQKDLETLVGKVQAAKSKEKAKASMKDDLIAALKNAQELGIETAAAKKIKYWVGDIEATEARQNQERLAKTRQKNLERLREATKDDLEAQAMQRLEKLTSEAHIKRLEAAKDDSVYDLKKFYRIRSNEDYTETMPEEDRALAAKLKLWSRSKPIPKSLLKLTDEQNRTALRINRAILQYCGDMSTSFPATLAQYVLVKGLEDEQMCDEIFIQLCKHIFANPKMESADRAWLLMCMATKTFPPTESFSPYLLNFLLKHKNLSGLSGNYARLCIVQLDATIDLGPSIYKPNLEEIQSYRKRPPVLATIKMINGELVEFPVSPELRIAQVLEMIRRREGIEDDIETPSFGIFVKDARNTGTISPRQRLHNFYSHYNPSKLKHVELFLEHWKGKEEELFAKLVDKYGPEPAESVPSKQKGGLLSASVTAGLHAAKMLGLTTARKTPPAPVSAWPLPWWAHAGDVYLRMTAQGKQPVFEFKRRLFLPNMEEDVLLYQQLLHDFVSGDLIIPKEDLVAELALIAVAMNSPKLKPPKPEKLVESGLTNYISLEWRRKKSPHGWAKLAASLNITLPRTEAKLAEKYIGICKQSPVYGMVFFAGRQADSSDDLTIGVDANGVHFLVKKPDGKVEVLKTYTYRKITKYGASVEYFWLSFDDGKGGKAKGFGGGPGQNVLIYTLQSWELYEVVFDYTHAPIQKKSA